MKITAIEPLTLAVNHRGDWIAVLIQTDAGITGWGEASHSGNDALAIAALEKLGAGLVDKDPRRIRAAVAEHGQTRWRARAQYRHQRDRAGTLGHPWPVAGGARWCTDGRCAAVTHPPLRQHQPPRGRPCIRPGLPWPHARPRTRVTPPSSWRPLMKYADRRMFTPAPMPPGVPASSGCAPCVRRSATRSR